MQPVKRPWFWHFLAFFLFITQHSWYVAHYVTSRPRGLSWWYPHVPSIWMQLQLPIVCAICLGVYLVPVWWPKFVFWLAQKPATGEQVSGELGEVKAALAAVLAKFENATKAPSPGSPSSAPAPAPAASVHVENLTPTVES